ncbi:MAG: hypothetical protein RSA23_09725 [Carnobacterium sp.]
MAHNGIINGFHFDPEVFTDYMQEQSCINNKILTSGILMYDPKIEEAIGGSSNIGKIPYFKSMDNEGHALNDDGKTDNIPTGLTGGKQTFMAIARMKSWYQDVYTRYLTGKNPLENFANNLVIPYWKNEWEYNLMAITKGIMGTTGMATHKTNLAVTTGTITDVNKVDLTTHLDLGQKALGDKRTNFSLFVCHSTVATNLKKKEAVENKKYFSSILGEIELPTLGTMIVLETDTNTVDTSVTGFPVYHSYMFGKGVFLTAPKQVPNPYGMEFDQKTKGGVETIYTKQAMVLHPNGFDIIVNNIVEESPTIDELSKSTNWELKFDNKQIAIAEIISNG